MTPKALMSWDGAAKAWILSALHPGFSLEDVQENTGFPLRSADPLLSTPPPTERELTVLRTTVREKLRRIYPDFAENKIRKMLTTEGPENTEK